MSAHKRLHTRLFGACCALMLLPVSIIASAEDRWYQAEVIIFSQLSAAYRHSERWPLDYTLPELAGSRELQPARQGAPAPFSLVPKERLKMGDTASRIARSKDLKLLLHLGWVQPGLPEDKAVAVHLFNDGSGGAGSPKLDGTLRLILSRYLHLESDLMLREAQPRNAMAEGEVIDNGGGLEGAPLQVAAAAESEYQVYRLQQSRRMRSDEVHYIDHPMFGIIVNVTRYGER